MQEFYQIGKWLLIVGVFLVIMGILMQFGDKIPLIGKLPGDIYIKKKNFTFYFPITTSILLSLLLSLIIYLFKR